MNNDPFDFDINEWFSQDPLTPEQEEKELVEEKDFLLTCCGTCINFISIMAEAGLCKLNENGCICKNPTSIIDMFDGKCEKWEISNKT